MYSRLLTQAVFAHPRLRHANENRLAISVMGSPVLTHLLQQQSCSRILVFSGFEIPDSRLAHELEPNLCHVHSDGGGQSLLPWEQRGNTIVREEISGNCQLSGPPHDSIDS